MPVTVELRNVLNVSIDKLSPCGGFLNRVLPSEDTPPSEYPILCAVDRYGYTAFNYLQMDDFIREWDSLDLSSLSAEEARCADQLRKMALRCRSERLLLWFEGD